jgi:hypothetical protein
MIAVLALALLLSAGPSAQAVPKVLWEYNTGG